MLVLVNITFNITLFTKVLHKKQTQDNSVRRSLSDPLLLCLILFLKLQ